MICQRLFETIYDQFGEPFIDLHDVEISRTEDGDILFSLDGSESWIDDETAEWACEHVSDYGYIQEFFEAVLEFHMVKL